MTSKNNILGISFCAVFVNHPVCSKLEFLNRVICYKLKIYLVSDINEAQMILRGADQ